MSIRPWQFKTNQVGPLELERSVNRGKQSVLLVSLYVNCHCLDRPGGFNDFLQECLGAFIHSRLRRCKERRDARQKNARHVHDVISSLPKKNSLPAAPPEYSSGSCQGDFLPCYHKQIGRASC